DMEKNEGKTRLHRMTSRVEVSPLTSTDVNATEPVLSPDGMRVAYIRKTPGGEGQLALLALDGGESEVLTDFPLGITDPRWFPDGKRIAFLGWVLGDAPTPEKTRELLAAREKDPVKARVTEDRLYRFWDGWLTEGRVLHIFVIDIATRAVTDLIPDSRRWFDLMDPAGQYDISPDGTEIAFSANASLPPHHPHVNWDVFTVSTKGGKVKNLTEGNPADDVRPRYSPDGSTILYGMQRRNDFYADRVRLVAYDRKSGRHRVLTEAWDRSASAWEFIPGRSEYWLAAEDEGRIGLFRGALDETAPQLVRRGGTYDGIRALADASVLAVRSAIASPPELVRVDETGERVLTHLNDELASRIAWGDVKEIRFRGSDDRDIQAYVVYPPGFDPSRKWPLIEMLHGGPHGITPDQFHFRWNLELLAAPGYVVLAPNFHGSTSWGQSFAECIQGGWGDKPYGDAMAAVDAILQEGYIDEARMAATGASYGGYLVAWIAGQTDRFACIVNHAGVADLLAEYASDVTYGWGKDLGGEPWDGLERIDRMNPIRFAHAMKTPMLITHGERDFRVPVDQGYELYNVLKAKGVPARLVVFPDENHWVMKPQNSRFWYGEVTAWLERWLSSGPTRPESKAIAEVLNRASS
ncbi:MAG TPA: S9 family peptidase, partial [Candidatus Eisenbacteria bacterium]|nr:S9 family peptidase [Candidatus Eisenbacteria bacterium]